MTIRLTLLAAAGPGSREARFPEDAPLPRRAFDNASESAPVLPFVEVCFSAPSVRCHQTIAALGLQLPVVDDPMLRDISAGSWAGLTPDDVAARDPHALAAWTADPSSAPPGGESVDMVRRRIGRWLESLPEDAGPVLAVTTSAVIRAAVVYVLAAPTASFWHVDVPPLSATRLVGYGGRWNVRLGG
jgi:broad specificity phosphatase PhoE